LSEPAPHDSTSPVLDGGQFIHRFWVRQQPGTISFWLSLKKSPLFELFFSNPFYKPTNPILELATPLPLPTFLVGPTL